ncbi:MAG TPA: hypothetical protein VGM46_05130 [Mesorhizobium sp.]|jgi:hypothetical protein
MNKMLGAAAMLAAFAVPSSAGTRYDHGLEKAAMDIVAGKMGDIRGGFSYAQKPQMVVSPGKTPAPNASPPLMPTAGDSVEALPLQSGPAPSITTF